ncbi:carboxymuconolactone decarboxylase family protein [Microbacterium sp.]|uniref:carboxymuconolactone decarboxylase family protein n=1 Tax=Microbacterium sp. TaxID=51671 RepID=UPI003A88B257
MVTNEPTDDWKANVGKVSLTARQTEIREAFIARRGYWADDWQLILELDPEFLARYTEVSAYAGEHATAVADGGLDRKSRELIYVALCAQLTHPHPPGILGHGRNAIAAGATPQEVLAVMELVSTLGVAGLHLAVRELEADAPGTVAGLAAQDGTTDAEVATLSEQFRSVYGAWDDEVEDVLRAAAGFYRTVIDLSEIPRHSGVLDPKLVALITFATDAFVTHRDEAALRRDIRAAKAAGVSPRELLDVVIQTCGAGIHAVTVGAPLLAQLMAEPAPDPA